MITVALPFSAHRVARIGIGTTVTHIGGHSVKEGLVPLDIMLEAHVETDEHGLVFAHQPHIWADPAMRECRHLRHWIPWKPTDEQLLSHDRGLTLPNSERLRTTDFLGAGRFRVQSRFHFRPNVTAYPFETEHFRFRLQACADADRGERTVRARRLSVANAAMQPAAGAGGTHGRERRGAGGAALLDARVQRD